jgi:alpha-ketoglutarate-dependent taurine dioxygenase
MTRLVQEQIKPKIGSRVLNSKDELLSGALSAQLNALLEDRGVLVFPEVHFTDTEQVEFTNMLGGMAREMRGEDVFKISLDRRVNREAVEYLKGSLFWHIDGTMNKVPIRASILSSKVLPSWGGNTEFANTYAAYEDLSAEMKQRIEGMQVVHAMWVSQLYHTPEPTLAQLEDWQARGEAVQPLVWTHQSGRKSLVLGNTAERVIGLDTMESAKVLHGLREHATSEPYHYAHEWKLGDAVMWDNTGSLHRAMAYDPDCGRLLHRTILRGTEPAA